MRDANESSQIKSIEPISTMDGIVELFLVFKTADRIVLGKRNANESREAVSMI